ncbi:cytochrome P450 [Usnea florida]
MRLTLYLLNAVCFGSRQDLMAELIDSVHPSSGHQLTYSQAMHTLVDYMPTIFLVGPSLLKISPFKPHKEAWQSYLELRKHMDEPRDYKTMSINSKIFEEGNSILDLVVQAGLPQMLGNMFIFMFAGHDASANTMTFLIILLACHPSMQRRLQHDIDRIFGSAPPLSQSWSYETAYPLLSESMLAAVINETLRLFTVLPFIPKKITNESSCTLKIAERTYNLLPGQGQAGTNHNPVADFDPDAWFYTDFGDTKSQEGTRRLRRPQEGSYVPFSDGHRGCLGKKFALVELYGVVARIFSEYTVELALDGILEQQNDDSQEANRWKEARKRAEHQLSAGIEFKMSLRPVGIVPLNFVKRGNESFAGL